MPLRVDLSNPLEWIVHVGQEPNDNTWPFFTREQAETFYEAMVKSGRFTYRTRGAHLEVILVGIWHREWHTKRDTGEQAVHYVLVEPGQDLEEEGA